MNPPAEEEKKVLAPLLGKLYVSPACSEDKIRDVYADVCEAVEHNLLSDATGRNALYKIHVSLGKIVNNLDAQEGAGATGGGAARAFSRSVSVAVDDKTAVDDRTVVPDADIKEEPEEEDGVDEGDTVADDATVVPGGGAEDSLVSALLDDDGDTEMT
jgi:condensin complex subunit 3